MTSRWVRPAGPPKVYKIVEGHETRGDGTNLPVKFSIQEIPTDRQQEVMDHLYTYFLASEPLSKCTDIKNDPNGVEDFRTFWKYGLEQGASIGCYKLDSDGKIGELAGVNVLFIMTDETVKDFSKLKNTIKSASFQKIWDLFATLGQKVDAFKIYNVDKYIGSISLSVSPSFRGQKLGYHLLSTRSNIAEHYGLKATCTMFTANQSQVQAARAGFEEKCSLDYANYVDADGKPIFPNIDWKNVKMMGRTLP